MKAPTSLLNRPGRAAAVVGAVLAISAGATVALVSTASADEPGRCIENVNVRENPDIDSRIVALCEAGTEVQVGETRDGFVHLTDLGGWSAQQYVTVNGRPPAPAAEPDGTDGDSAEQDTTEPDAADEEMPGDTTDAEPGTAEDTGSGTRGPLGGLLG
ncbi:hypothetical protein BJF78_35555 [Pseudonocardia sp. CNS-139]|nr:hypothetical protein BJF78_35555 [Pseudonocardia sp. CNS-139]